MEFLPGQSRARTVATRRGVVASSVNRARQAVDGSVDDGPAVHAPRQAPAMLVGGVDAFGHFDLEPAPGGDLDDAAQAAFARSYEGYRAAYAEQVTTPPSP